MGFWDMGFASNQGRDRDLNVNWAKFGIESTVNPLLSPPLK